jgi:prepilin-type N-terminal cleavage/methylation domain-containing protein
MKQLNNHSGFTLVEMMIVVSILSIVALGLSTYMYNLSKQQKHAQENADMILLKSQVQAAAIDAQGIFDSSNATN